MGTLANSALGSVLAVLVVAACEDGGSETDPAATTGTTPTSAPPGGAPYPEVCVRTASCLGLTAEFWCWIFSGKADPVPVYSGIHRQLGQLYQCLAAADDCAQMVACATASEEDLAVCGSGIDYACHGDRLVACDDFVEDVTYDCAASGLHCGSLAGWACCGLGPCDPSAGDQASCVDGRLVSCDPRCGMLVETDCRYGCGELGCSLVGGICGTAASGGAACIGPGAACDSSTGDPYCEGSTFVLCVNGYESRVDCADNSPPGMERTCVPERGCRAGTECDPASVGGSCVGTVARFCLEGRWQEVDCVELGFSGCLQTEQGVSCEP